MTTATTPVTNPNVTRSRLVLEIASEMARCGAAADAVPDYILPKVELRHSAAAWQARDLFRREPRPPGIFAVAAREIDLAMINPAAVLSRVVALRGQGIFKITGMPVRASPSSRRGTLSCLPCAPRPGLTRCKDIAAQKPKLRILMRATPDHSLHHMTRRRRRGGGFFAPRHRALGRRSAQGRQRLVALHRRHSEALIRGDVDAIFDEAAHSLGCRRRSMPGITILPLAETTVTKLEVMGYRRAVLPQSAYPKLPHDVLSLDFFRLDGIRPCRRPDRCVGDADLRRP